MFSLFTFSSSRKCYHLCIVSDLGFAWIVRWVAYIHSYYTGEPASRITYVALMDTTLCSASQCLGYINWLGWWFQMLPLKSYGLLFFFFKFSFILNEWILFQVMFCSKYNKKKKPYLAPTSVFFFKSIFDHMLNIIGYKINLSQKI